MIKDTGDGDFEAYLERLKKFFEENIPFNVHLGMRIEEMYRDFARVSVWARR